MTDSIRNFQNQNFTPKLRVSQGQTSRHDRLAHTPLTRDRCPHRVLSSASESQRTECCSRYSASGHLQKFASDLSLSTFQNSQPYKIFKIKTSLQNYAFLKVKPPDMTDWHILPGLETDVPIVCCHLPVSPREPSVAQDTVPVVIYRSLHRT